MSSTRKSRKKFLRNAHPSTVDPFFGAGTKMSRKKKLRKQAWDENSRCCWCERPLRFSEATLEHIVRRSEGGTNKASNLAVACAPCNNFRHRHGWAEWVEQRRRGTDLPFEMFTKSWHEEYADPGNLHRYDECHSQFRRQIREMKGEQ